MDNQHLGRIDTWLLFEGNKYTSQFIVSGELGGLDPILEIGKDTIHLHSPG